MSEASEDSQSIVREGIDGYYCTSCMDRQHDLCEDDECICAETVHSTSGESHG